MRILIVEDDQTIASALKEGLEGESYAVDLCFDGQDGYLTATTENYDVIVLDIMLPEIDGISLCKKLRESSVESPILMLTAKGTKSDIITGLDAGADDYLTKPFDFEELLARIRALLRRPTTKSTEVLQVGDLLLDPASKKVTRSSKEISLTSKEYALLEYLMRNPDVPHSKDEIISHVWDFDSTILPNNVELFIMFLRKKIDKPFHTKLIHTKKGFGYVIGKIN